MRRRTPHPPCSAGVQQSSLDSETWWSSPFPGIHNQFCHWRSQLRTPTFLGPGQHSSPPCSNLVVGLRFHARLFCVVCFHLGSLAVPPCYLPSIDCPSTPLHQILWHMSEQHGWLGFWSFMGGSQALYELADAKGHEGRGHFSVLPGINLQVLLLGGSSFIPDFSCKDSRCPAIVGQFTQTTL